MGYGAPYYPAPREQGSDMAIAGLILGIIAIPAASFAACGVLFGALGLVFSILGRKSFSQRTMATVGIVLSSVALALSLIQILGGIVASLNLMQG
jgi:protein-S-isoprenylcysteine O-methyltransferase Ste14